MGRHDGVRAIGAGPASDRRSDGVLSARRARRADRARSDTAYHWRIVASNSAGTVDGPDHVDKTQPKPWIPHETVPPSGRTELPVPVSSVGSIAGSEPVANYDWNFSGNGTTGLVCPAGMPIAYHTYSRPGTYTVTLTITTVTGQTFSTHQQIVVGGNGGNIIGGPPPNNGGGACATVAGGGARASESSTGV